MDHMIIDNVRRECSGLPLRIAAAILRLRRFSALFIYAYMGYTEGIGEYSTIILKSIRWLVYMLGCPFILGGDF